MPDKKEETKVDLSLHIKSVYGGVKTLLKKEDVTLASVVSITTIVMIYINANSKLRGHYKKEICKEVLHLVVNERVLKESDASALHKFIDGPANTIIDNIIKYAKSTADENLNKCCVLL